MADIQLGNGFSLYYNADLGNRTPQGVGNVEVPYLITMPTFGVSSQTSSFQTYNEEYTTVLVGGKSVDDMQFTVAYVADLSPHVYLDNAVLNQTEIQMILYYTEQDHKVTFAILNGNLVSSEINGDTNQVLSKTYKFVTTDMVQNLITTESLLPVYQGDYGVGSNGIVPQYTTATPVGNSFSKIPASQPGNPAGADMMGVSFNDNNVISNIAVTKSGTLSLFAKNGSTAWTRIYTATQMDDRYTPLSRTVNGKPLTGDITLTSTDTGSVPTSTKVNGKTLTGDITLTSADTGSVPTSTKVNGKALTGDITLAKSDVGLSNVTNDAQLKIASNLSDVGNVATARTNLGVLSSTESDAKYLIKSNNLSDLTNTDTAKINLGISYLIQNGTWTQMYSPLADGSLGRGDYAITITANGDWGSRNKNDGTWKSLLVSNGGTGANTAAGARTNLGLGSAATVNTGTSGGTIPLLNGANTWSGSNTFSAATFTTASFGGSSTSSTGIEIGSITTAGSAYVDLHSSGTNNDYDVRIISSGGSSTVGQGNLSITANTVQLSTLNLTNALSIANGGTGSTTASDARNNLGLGTAATVNTGTSGGTVPLLNGNNTWSGATTFANGQTVFSPNTAGGIEIGCMTAPGAAYIDLHSSGTGSDYDVRIRADGGSSTAGGGTLTIRADGGVALSAPLGIGSGGTGANNVTDARNNLGVGELSNPVFGSMSIRATSSGGLPLINLRPYGTDDNPKTQIYGLADGTCQIHTFDSSGTRKRYFFADQYRHGTANLDRTVITNGDFGLGAGSGSYITPTNHGPENSFISGGGGGTLAWCPSGAGWQSSYGDNRTGQMIIQPNTNVAFRWVQASSETAITTTPYTLLQNAGTSDINFKHVNGDLDVHESLSNIEQMEFKRFYYLDDESETERRGVIAQQIEQIDPEYVHGAESTGKMTLDLNPLIMDSLAAIKCLSTYIKEQQTQIDELKALIESLK
ncbi:tail fiber domain-containing protein [Enterobacter soli]|uniref:tail fiber domain-containing protein n=1 Tax=Enterobacter soli TaxID=885040 RepID=UPI004046A0D7